MLFFQLLSLVGITLIITKSYLFDSVRRLVDKLHISYLSYLVSCSQCSGFWIGVAGWLVFDRKTWEGLIIYPASVSLLSMITAAILEYLEESALLKR